MFEFTLEIKTNTEKEQKLIEMSRYTQAIDLTLKENDKTFSNLKFKIIKIQENIVFLRIVI